MYDPAVPEPLCEVCVHRDKLAGGRGDCTVRMWDTVEYGLIATGVQRYCPLQKVERSPLPVAHPGQLALEVEA